MLATETQTTAPRLDWKAFQEAVPEFAISMAALTHALKKSGLEPELRELIKIRASQLNGCAFCVQYHLNDARKIAAWREAGIYSPREAAALEWTERVTLLAQTPIEDAAWDRLREHFSPTEAALLTAAISQINAWNRIAAPFRFAPPIPQSANAV
jgi:AhpD family alkylhydroperoxidase